VADRYDVLPPGAAEASVRSLRRRFAHAVSGLPADPTDREQLLTLTDDGVLACRALAGVVPTLAAAEQNVRRITRRAEATLDGSLQAPPVAWDAVGAEVDRIGAAADRFADLLRSLGPHDWTRTGRGPAGPVSAIDVTRDAVRLSIEALRTVERCLGVDPN
jgi:hypothetical protein